MNPHKHGWETPWEEAAEGLCAAVEKRIEATARKAAESLYEGLLYDTQAYLRENTLLNLKGELDRALSEASLLRTQLNRVADAAGFGPQAYYERTADRAIEAIDRMRAKAAASPELYEAASLALKSILDEAEARNFDPPADPVLVAELEAALSKAKAPAEGGGL